MRLQGNEQVVCQLLIATYCRNCDVNWHGIAGNVEKAANFYRLVFKASEI
jgi:hypothetical protein